MADEHLKRQDPALETSDEKRFLTWSKCCGHLPHASKTSLSQQCAYSTSIALMALPKSSSFCLAYHLSYDDTEEALLTNFTWMFRLQKLSKVSPMITHNSLPLCSWCQSRDFRRSIGFWFGIPSTVLTEIIPNWSPYQNSTGLFSCFK